MSAQKLVVIFDFDGTLADVVPLMRKIYTDVAVKRGYPELTEADYQQLRRGTLKDLMKWAGIRTWQLPSVLREGRRIFYQHRAEVALFPGATELIKDLHSSDVELYILSSNSVRTIRSVLDRQGVPLDAVHVLRRPPLMGKASSIRNLVQRHGYDRAHVWMIGDETRDIDAARKARIQSVAVGWGLQHEEVLLLFKPTYLAKTYTQLRNILMKEVKNAKKDD